MLHPYVVMLSQPGLAQQVVEQVLMASDVKIVDLTEGKKEVAIGEEGELCIAGPQIMQGYWNRPDETEIALRKDAGGRVWLYTGDVAHLLLGFQPRVAASRAIAGIKPPARNTYQWNIWEWTLTA